MVRFREHRQQPDEVLSGGWFTEERMKVDLKYSQKLHCIFSFCFSFWPRELFFCAAQICELCSSGVTEELDQQDQIVLHTFWICINQAGRFRCQVEFAKVLLPLSNCWKPKPWIGSFATMSRSWNSLSRRPTQLLWKNRNLMPTRKLRWWIRIRLGVSMIVCVSVSVLFFLNLEFGMLDPQNSRQCQRCSKATWRRCLQLVRLLLRRARIAHLVNSYDEVKQSLEKFTESLHQKAVQVTGWLAAVDKDSSARAKSLLAISIVDFVRFFCWFFWDKLCTSPWANKNCHFFGWVVFWIFGRLLHERFCESCEQQLTDLEACFLKLAECQHLVDTATEVTPEYLVWTFEFRCFQVSLHHFSALLPSGCFRRSRLRRKLRGSRPLPESLWYFFWPWKISRPEKFQGAIFSGLEIFQGQFYFSNAASWLSNERCVNCPLAESLCYFSGPEKFQGQKNFKVLFFLALKFFKVNFIFRMLQVGCWTKGVWKSWPKSTPSRCWLATSLPRRTRRNARVLNVALKSLLRR